MSEDLTTEGHCKSCGTAITGDAPFGHCPKCLIQIGFDPIFKEDLDQPVELAALSPPAAQVPEIRSALQAIHGLPDTTTGKPGDRIGRYKLLERIGEGGFGVVYMAEQEEPVCRRVALKILKLGMDTKEVVARFEAERQALAMMDHPHIAKIYDGGATPTGRPYFVMELVHGVRITDYCEQKKLSTRDRLELFMQVCHAVQHAHQKGLIHRDIKPSNILVTVNEGLPVPKVIDFGIAKATRHRLTEKTLFTKFNQLVGTPAYMSPEQAEMTSVDIDTRSDIYSLGVLLYKLLTGSTPFDTKVLLQSGFEEVLRTIREQEPARPSARLSTLAAADLTSVARERQTEAHKLVHLLRGDLDWIVMMCLEKDRARRYETANELAMDVRRHLANEPVLARPPATAYRLGKLVRKHWTAISVGASFALLLTAATVVSLWLAGREHQERAKASKAESAANNARKRAEDESRRRLAVLSEMQIQRAEEFFVAEDSSRAVAQLASVLTADRSNHTAAERMMSALTFRNFGLPVTAPLRHGAAVRYAEFSPDGLRVVTSSEDRTARVWDAQSAKALTKPLQHEGIVRSARFSPDGRLVITASDDKTARVWDAQTGEPVTDPLRHQQIVHSAKFSPDGRQVVTAASDRVQVWDARTGKALTDPLPHEGLVWSVEFSPDGRRVLTACDDRKARLWDAQNGKQLTDKLRHKRSLLRAKFSPDGLRVVTASFDGTARVWDAQTGEPLTEPIRHEAPVRSAEFSPDGLRLVTTFGDQEHAARVWDAKTGMALTSPLRHERQLSSAVFSPDGLRILTASEDDTARVWDSHTGKPLTEPLRHGNRVTYARFSPDGLRVVTASTDNTARIWDVRHGSLLPERLQHDFRVLSGHFSRDGRRVVTASMDMARVWDARSASTQLKQLRCQGTVWSAQFSADGLRVVTASPCPTAYVWDAQTGKPLTTLRYWQDVKVAGPSPNTPMFPGFSSAQFSPDGLRVVTASADGTARVWDALTGKLLTEPLQHEAGVSHAEFSPDGLRVVTSSGDRTARVWDAQSAKALTKPLQHEGIVRSAKFSPDGRLVVTASADRTARVWDSRNGQPLTDPLLHEGEVSSARFSADGRRVVTASWEDGTARIWDAQTGRCLTESLRHKSGIPSAQFSPDGRRVVTASMDHTTRIWDAQNGKPLTEALRHDAPVRFAEFSSDGRRVITTSDDKTARVWDMASPLPVSPSWLAQLAAAVAGRKFSETGTLETAEAEDLLTLRHRLINDSETNYYAQWARWFLADRATRTISPLSTVTVPEYVQQRISEHTVESILESLHIDPTNGLAFAELARLLLAQPSDANARRIGEAEFFSRWAIHLSPNEPEVRRVRVEILNQIEKALKP